MEFIINPKSNIENSKLFRLISKQDEEYIPKMYTDYLYGKLYDQGLLEVLSLEDVKEIVSMFQLFEEWDATTEYLYGNDNAYRWNILYSDKREYASEIEEEFYKVYNRSIRLV